MGIDLDRSLILSLADCDWIHNGTNVLITGPCGTGKSWIACALAHKACLEGYQALYLRMPRLLTQLRIAHGEGTIPKLYHDLARLDLIVLDDWGIAPIDAHRRSEVAQQYRTILTQAKTQNEHPHVPPRITGQRDPVAKPASVTLWQRLKTHEADILRFAHNPAVAFTNNRAERDVRMAKVKQKVSGRFRNAAFAKFYCRVSSHLQSMA